MRTWMTSWILALSLLGLGVVAVTGCAKKRPDPKARPDFVDTSDPSKVQMKPLPKGTKKK